MKSSVTWQRIQFGLSVGIFTWYFQVLPIALTGYWRKLLIPHLGMFTDFWQVYLIIMIWLIFGSKRSLVIVTGTVLAVAAASVILLRNYPYVSMIPKFGMRLYVINWAMTLLPCFISPVLAALLLARADQIAPKFIKRWSRVNE